jgi:hypothetical protein
MGIREDGWEREWGRCRTLVGRSLGLGSFVRFLTFQHLCYFNVSQHSSINTILCNQNIKTMIFKTYYIWD